jgi:hypothetical protein
VDEQRRSTDPIGQRGAALGGDRPGPTAIFSPDRVPDGLHLEEGGDPFGPFGETVIEPVEARLVDRGRAPQQALDVLGGTLLDLETQVVGDPPGVERVDVRVCGENGDQLALAGQS